jgi:hypothetical protein
LAKRQAMRAAPAVRKAMGRTRRAEKKITWESNDDMKVGRQLKRAGRKIMKATQEIKLGRKAETKLGKLESEIGKQMRKGNETNAKW